MFKYLIKYTNFAIKIQVDSKQKILSTALCELRKLTQIEGKIVIWVYDKEFDENYIITDLEKAPDSGILKLEEVEINSRLVIYFNMLTRIAWYILRSVLEMWSGIGQF
jgi:hypothetical protein